MVRGEKKKNAGRGCVLFLFQRDNVEVCFTCPALHQCTQSLGSTKNILFTAKLCLSTAQEKLSGIFSFSCDFFFSRDLCWIWSHEITHKFSNKPFLSCPNLLSPKWEAQLLTFSSHWWFSVDNFIGHKYLVLLWSRDSCHSDSAQHTSSTKILSRTKNQKFKNVKNRISCSFTDFKKKIFQEKNGIIVPAMVIPRLCLLELSLFVSLFCCVYSTLSFCSSSCAFHPPLLCSASFSCGWLPGQGWFLPVFLLLGASSGSPGNGGAPFESCCAAHTSCNFFLSFIPLKSRRNLPSH